MTEEPDARSNRELIELLNELRVALPGVQVLFAFLLAVPFAIGFKTVTEFQRDVYFVTLMATAIAAVLLITPSALHRLRFRQHDREFTLIVSNRFAIAGLGFLALAMTGVVALVTDYIYDPPVAIAATAFIAVMFVGCWYVLPLSRRYQRREDEFKQEQGRENES